MNIVQIHFMPSDFIHLAAYARRHGMNKTADLIQYADQSEPLRLPAFVVAHLFGLMKSEGLTDSRLALILAYDLQG